MLFSSLLALAPLVAAGGVHKLKLNKLPPAVANPDLESLYLAEKYGSPSRPQTPLMGAGGAGRRFDAPESNDDDLFWTQGGHEVPLTSTSMSRRHPRRPN